MSSIIILAGSGILAAAGIIENIFHQKRLKDIPIRINVNGTRGKSTVTRLIAAGLRAGNIHTVAKTTGTAPMLILPDGNEIPIIRKGQPKISEHVWVTKKAHKEHAEALVVECMALEPENQNIYEHMLVKSTIGVITNIRSDHTEVMGPEIKDIAETLAITVPKNGIMVTVDNPYIDIIKNKCRNHKTVLHIADPCEIDDAELSQFGYTSFADNVAIALKVCMLSGVNRTVALKGMLEAKPDPGTIQIIDTFIENRKLHIVNAFAANDVQSTKEIWDTLISPAIPSFDKILLVVSNRFDRPQRVKELSEMAVTLPVDSIFYVGDLSSLAFRYTPPERPYSPEIRLIKQRNPRKILSCIANTLQKNESAILFLVGNTKGVGNMLTDYLQTKAEAEFA